MGLNTHEKNLIVLWICVEIAICNNKFKNETGIIIRAEEALEAGLQEALKLI